MDLQKVLLVVRSKYPCERPSSLPLDLVYVGLLDQLLHQVIWFHPPTLPDIDKHLVMDIADFH